MIMRRVITANNQYRETQERWTGVIAEKTLNIGSFFASGFERFVTRYEYTLGLRKEALPKINWAKTEKKAKCSSPPETLNSGFITTCINAIEAPMRKREKRNTGYVGKNANNNAPIVAKIQPPVILIFSLYF